MKNTSILLILCFILCVHIINAQSTSELLDLSIIKNNQQTVTLSTALSSERNNILVLFSWDCPTCITSLESWKAHYARWGNTYDIQITVVDMTSGYRPRQAFEQYNQSQLPFNYVISASTPEAYYVSNDRLTCYYLSPNLNEEAIHQTISLQGVQYILNELYRPASSPIMFSGDFSQTIFSGSDCATAATHRLNAVLDTIANTIHYEKVSYRSSNYYLRADSLGVYRLLHPTMKEIKIADYSLSVCDTFNLTFSDGQQVTGWVEEKYYKNEAAHFVTNIPIRLCNSGDTTSLTFIEGIGSNAGLIYDWTGDAINSHLLCYTESGQLKYRNAVYGGECSIDYSSIEKNPHSIHPIKLYPNPVQDQLQITHDAEGTYELFTLSGKKILDGKLIGNQSTLVLSNLFSGCYLFKAKFDNEYYCELLIKD